MWKFVSTDGGATVDDMLNIIAAVVLVIMEVRRRIGLVVRALAVVINAKAIRDCQEWHQYFTQ